MDDWRIAGRARSAVRHRLRLRHPWTTCRTRSHALRPRSRASTPTLIRRARDGAVSRSRDFPDEIVLHTMLGVSAGVSWEPIAPGVASDETHLSSVGTGAVEASGTGSLSTIKPGLTEADDAARDGGETVPELVEAADESMAAAPRPPRVGPGRAHATTPNRRTRTVSASWWPARSTTPAAPRRRAPPLAPLAPGLALVVHPSDLARIGVTAEGDDVRRHQRARHDHGAGAHRHRRRAGHRLHGVRAARRRSARATSSTSRRRSPTCGWRPRR